MQLENETCYLDPEFEDFTSMQGQNNTLILYVFLERIGHVRPCFPLLGRVVR